MTMHILSIASSGIVIHKKHAIHMLIMTLFMSNKLKKLERKSFFSGKF